MRDQAAERTNAAAGFGCSRRVVVGLLLLAAALRLPMLPLRRLAEGDGVHYAQLARAVLGGDFIGLANPYWSNLWPAVIAATAWLTRLDCVEAGRLASLVAGCCLAPATALLAARVFGTSTGIAAGLLVAIHPWLIHFSTLLFTESLFTLLLVMLLLASSSASSRTRSVVAMGVWAGLAVATRFEAFAAVAPVALWLAVRRGQVAGRAALWRALLFVGLVTVFVCARACLVHHYSGAWDFGGTKGTANLFLGLVDTDRERERVATELLPNDENALSRLTDEGSIVGFALTHPQLLAGHVWANLAELRDSALRVFPLVPLVGGRPALGEGGWPPLLAAWAIGLCVVASQGMVLGCWRQGLVSAASLLLVTGILYLAGLAPLLIHDRLIVPLVPLFAVFLGHGVVLGMRLVTSDEQRLQRVLTGALVIVGLFSVERLWHAPALDYAGDPVVQREAGEWLAAHFPQETVMMTAAPCVSYYFYDSAHVDQEVGLPWADYEAVLEVARRQGVALIVVPEWHLRAVQHPAGALLAPDGNHPGLRHVVTLGDETGRMFIYELEPRVEAP